MFTQISPLYFALSATLCFAYASTIFTEFARKISPLWMNAYKVFVAFFAFLITLLILNIWQAPTSFTIIALLLSGCIGLMIGDIFMLKAMAELGASRMLMIFGLQPFFLGIGGYFLFNQSFSFFNFLGVLFMSLCIFTIRLENYKKSGSWQITGLLAGLAAIVLDGIGILLTRFGFENSKGISPIEVNFIRCIGAILTFFFIYFYKDRIRFRPVWRKLNLTEKRKIMIGSLAGTYISLILYLTAVSKGKLSVVSSVTVTGPMFATLFEYIRTRKRPSFFLVLSFVFFLSGFVVFYKIS